VWRNRSQLAAQSAARRVKEGGVVIAIDRQLLLR